ncbi:MAG: GNAT family N-acetyltransferase [Hyphomicrobium sp.]
MSKKKAVLSTYNFSLFRHDPTQAVLGLIPQSDFSQLGRHFAHLDPWARLGIKAEALADYFSECEENAPRYAILIADEVAGIVGLKLNWLKGPYLQFLGLLPQHQRSGLGTAVLLWLLEEARRHLDHNVWVCASAFNTQALKFYEKFGFVRVAHLEGLVSSQEDEVLLRLRI